MLGQRQDPATDFRGFGVLGLDALLYFATQHTAVWQDLLRRNEARGAAREYPIATAGINACKLVDDEFRFAASDAAATTLLSPLALGDRPFEALVAIAMMIIDRHWDWLDASYMRFPEVVAAAKLELSEGASQFASLKDWWLVVSTPAAAPPPSAAATGKPKKSASSAVAGTGDKVRRFFDKIGGGGSSSGSSTGVVAHAPSAARATTHVDEDDDGVLGPPDDDAAAPNDAPNEKSGALSPRVARRDAVTSQSTPPSQAPPAAPTVAASRHQPSSSTASTSNAQWPAPAVDEVSASALALSQRVAAHVYSGTWCVPAPRGAAVAALRSLRAAGMPTSSPCARSTCGGRRSPNSLPARPLRLWRREFFFRCSFVC